MTDGLDKIFLSLSSPKRLDILLLLSRATELLATSTIAQILGMPPSLCSKHLQVLLETNLVIKGKSGPFALYSLNRQCLEKIETFTKEVLHVMDKTTASQVSASHQESEAEQEEKPAA